MKVSYLIDTDWVVNNLNGVRKVRTKLLELEPYGLGLSIISLAELYEGVWGFLHKTPKRYISKLYNQSGMTGDICVIVCLTTVYEAFTAFESKDS